MWDWNERQKIDPLGTLTPLDYMYSENEVDLRINFLKKQNPGSLLEGDSLLKCLRNAAVIAGTPGFLGAQTGKYENSYSTRNRWDRGALFFNELWKNGAETITWTYESTMYSMKIRCCNSLIIS